MYFPFRRRQHTTTTNNTTAVNARPFSGDDGDVHMMNSQKLGKAAFQAAPTITTQSAPRVQHETQPTYPNSIQNVAQKSHSAESNVSTTRRTITATVATNAHGLTVGRGAVLSATAGSRIVGSNIADILAILNKAKEIEEIDRDRHADILNDSRGAYIDGAVRAVAGVDVEMG